MAFWSYNMNPQVKMCAEWISIIGGGATAFFQVAGPVISFLAGVVSILWGGFSLYILIRDKLNQKK
jgi:hypothetical protein